VGCDGLFPTGNYACVAPGAHWCRNASNVACNTRDDCPACPTVNGREVPCARLCEPRLLKLYVRGSDSNGKPDTQLADLFLDPDEVSLHGGFYGSLGTLVGDMSAPGSRYEETARTLNCCVDDWWPETTRMTGTTCTASCPADLVCNE